MLKSQDCCRQYLGVGGFGGKLVPSFSLLIIEKDRPVVRANGKFGIVGGPGQTADLRRTLLSTNDDNLADI